MRRRLGVSVYPERTDVERVRSYLERAARLGFSRVFTCLLSVSGGADETIQEFAGFIRMAHDLGFTVSVDTNEDVFGRLGASPEDVGPFAEMGVDIIRLDGHFGDQGDIMLTRNAAGIAIEFNASGNLPLDLLIERGADMRNMVVCHNFYPEPYTGLSEETFQGLSARYRGMGLPVAAFVTSRQPGTVGPWPVSAGLPTCEDDRHRPIGLQARHLVASGLVDDILIGDFEATDAELRELAGVDLSRVTMTIETVPGIPPVEERIVWDYQHVTRGDASEYMLRSSFPRTDHRETSIPPRDAGCGVFRRGDVLVVNDGMAHYRGELEVALKDIPADGTRNLVGRVPEEELFLLDYVKPEHPFGFIRR
ncbi:MAG: DUF871 domain-containing protein [Coriobacteriaceae bacterium]|nr:DUF871 domain-containing protein [Coriobacteriaceae bacterium]